MTPAELSRTVLHAVCRAVEDGVLDVAVPESAAVERTRPGGAGDYASNIALRLAGPAGQPARAVAERLRERIGSDPAIASVEITGPGFLNFTLDSGARQELVLRVLARGQRYGYREPAVPESRARVWGDAVARLRMSQGESAAPRPGDPRPVEPAERPEEYGRLGADAVRWAFLSAAAHDRPRPGELLLRQHESNPLFTVRYAHARTRALTRDAARLGFTGQAGSAAGTGLTGLLAEYPETLASAARLGAPDRVARRLEAIAEALLAGRHTVLPAGDEKPSAAHRSRLATAEAAGAVLAGGLSLLGISAPEHL
ncbi:ArgS-related anticodon-binding protein NrtL [Streptomyces sp. CAU 1734]|uniref:ArgS-related anticodon-binding protein NrtL n=1 Tax=Streptomyces sp. CAU 1734 TaxID=3140360 RepID=UPI003260DB1C